MPTPEQILDAAVDAMLSPVTKIQDVDKQTELVTAAELRDRMSLAAEAANGSQKYVVAHPLDVEL